MQSLIIAAPVFALGACALGWWLRGRIETRVIYIRQKSRPMTTSERDRFDAAFEHFDRGMDAVRGIFS